MRDGAQRSSKGIRPPRTVTRRGTKLGGRCVGQRPDPLKCGLYGPWGGDLLASVG
jgi:hypothetical protein